MTVDAEWADVRAQLELEDRLPGWWGVHRVRRQRWIRDVEVPAGSYYAVSVRLSEPPVVAETLEELEWAVVARVLAAEPCEPERRSLIRELLAGSLGPDEVSRLEVAPGRWYLPGTPP